MSVTLLLVAQSIEVLLNLQSHDAGRGVGEKVLQVIRAHPGGGRVRSGYEGVVQGGRRYGRLAQSQSRAATGKSES